MIVKSFECTSCGDILYGRCEEDEQECTCHRTKLKGDYANPTILINDIELVLPQLEYINIKNVTADVLFWDWNLLQNNFGHITEFTHEETDPQHYKPTYLIEL